MLRSQLGWLHPLITVWTWKKRVIERWNNGIIFISICKQWHWEYRNNDNADLHRNPIHCLIKSPANNDLFPVMNLITIVVDFADYNMGIKLLMLWRSLPAFVSLLLQIVQCPDFYSNYPFAFFAGLCLLSFSFWKCIDYFYIKCNFHHSLQYHLGSRV